ncbi:MAG: APC family permease [Acidobacteriota bacterium]
MKAQETSGAADGTSASLRRAVGVPGAVLMGLGSILGTGVFVSLGLGAGIAGPAVVLAVALAAGVAACNGLSSAQLAARHPVSGGTYEYGYRRLTPALGFTAGWMFLCAKSASAATAALGLAGYLLSALGRDPGSTDRALLAVAAVAVLTAVVAGGITGSNRLNAIMVGTTILALAAFVAIGTPAALGTREHFTPFFSESVGLRDLLHATALMFVAYTGYGRIATLGEEVREPRRSIPRAIITALVVTLLLYAAVVTVGIGAVGADRLAAATLDTAAPLEEVARQLGHPGLAVAIVVGAVTAMVSVLLNLLLGLSRVLLAMARRGDMPRALAHIETRSASPARAVVVVGVGVGLFALTGSVATTWSFSAFTVLVYYALTNLAALQLAPEDRLYPRWISWLGLASCLGLAFWVETRFWAAGLALIGVGLLWHQGAKRLASAP